MMWFLCAICGTQTLKLELHIVNLAAVSLVNVKVKPARAELHETGAK